MYQPIRCANNPIIHSQLDQQIGENINGPSLVRVPEWVANPLGRYYLYFAHHQGKFIRMAYADELAGPWTVHQGGVLSVDETVCHNHIASPDVHVCAEQRQIRMYFHGVTDHGQLSFVALSPDGLQFTALPVALGPYYFRVFQHQDAWFAFAKLEVAEGGGLILRSADGLQPFERGPTVLLRQRHVAVRKHNDELHIFYSRGEDCPECILLSTMALTPDWQAWQPGAAVELMRSETTAEGVHLPIEPSRFGAVHRPVHELRDPAIFEENGRLYLLYAGAGESNICLAELVTSPDR